jgi:hypothetical protein
LPWNVAAITLRSQLAAWSRAVKPPFAAHEVQSLVSALLPSFRGETLKSAPNTASRRGTGNRHNLVPYSPVSGGVSNNLVLRVSKEEIAMRRFFLVRMNNRDGTLAHKDTP